MMSRSCEGNTEAKEHALQVVDVAALRPEVRLTYVGIHRKCFEILEIRGVDDEPETTPVPLDPTPQAQGEGEDEDAGEEDDDDADADGGAGESDADDPLASMHGGISGLMKDDNYSDMSESEAEGDKMRLKLREILFYDDKVAVFKARHGRL